ncbi:MAG: hypothetical protein U9P14_12335 [Gemmatimonadota bacterium]|nr:hypothetical protein [Gemmatimonadota bacterium]
MYPSPFIRFGSLHCESEWFETGYAGGTKGPGIHPALYVAVLAACLWHFRRTGEPAVVTHLLRSSSEQRRLYPHQPHRRSPHQYGRAADLRTRHLDDSTAEEWAEWVNRSFDYRGRAGVQTALYHQVGNHGHHLHLQVGPAEDAPPVPDSFVLSA